MKISIVTPSFNQGEYLPQAIQSVVDQKYPDWEHIIYDGGSTDQTLKILEEYKKHYPNNVFWVSEKDKGQSDALNKALRRASGDLLVWLNTDDYFEAGTFHTIAHYFQQHPDVDMVYGKALAHNMLETETKTYELPTQPFNLRALINDNNYMVYLTVFWRRSLLETVGCFNEDLHYSMDLDYYIRVGLKAKIDYIPQLFGHFRIHGSSKSGASSDRFWKEWRRISRQNGGAFFSEAYKRHVRQNVSMFLLKTPRGLRRAVYRLKRVIGKRDKTSSVHQEMTPIAAGKKRVCIVNFFVYNIYRPKIDRIMGGAETQLYFLMEELKKHKKIEVHVLSTIEDYPEIEIIDGITFWKVRDDCNKRFRNFWSICKMFLDLKRINADVYILRSASFEVGLVAFFCKLFHRQMIFMVASSIDSEGIFSRESSRQTAKMYEYGLRHASIILAQNQEQIQGLKKNYGVSAELFLNGFKIKPYTNTDVNKKTILWVGRGHPIKQPEIFVDLAQKFPEEQFVMILNRQDRAVTASVESHSRDLKNFRLLHFVPLREIDQYFQEAKLFVNTSTLEGFPNTFIQAGMYYCPILSLIVNPDLVLDRHHIGWCAHGDKDAFYHLTEHILTHQDEREEYAKNARHYVERFHDIGKNVERIQELIFSQ